MLLPRVRSFKTPANHMPSAQPRALSASGATEHHRGHVRPGGCLDSEHATVCGRWHPIAITKSVVARGSLYVDFCVPKPGLGTCDTTIDPAAPDVTANLTFGYGLVGAVTAILGKATFAASASIVDLERSAFINYQALGELSATLGSVKKIAEIPVPLPDFSQAQTSLPVTFTALLKRGRLYRFQLSGASTAQAAPGGGALSDFYTSANFSLQPGRVQLHNLTIQIGQSDADLSGEVAALKTLVGSLQNQVGNLGDALDSLRDSFDTDTSALRAELNDLAKRVDVPGTLLFLPVGSPTPPGYVFVGTFDLAPSGTSRGRGSMMSVAVYRRSLSTP